MNILSAYGWNSFHDVYLFTHADHLYGRVISIKGFKYELITSNGVLDTELSGRLLFATSQEALPKVGDWVSYLDYGATGYIVDVFPRANELARKSVGSKAGRQVIATNIDEALVVQGLDQNYNLMRLERYMTQLAACNINVSIVLNKCDLVDNTTRYLQKIATLGRNVSVTLCSTYTGSGLDTLLNSLSPGKTYIMVGSSGVGKSSLINFLAGEYRQSTGETSESNNKGRHTTTSRELFKLPNGSLMIDTPGMREFGVTGAEDAEAGSTFPLIDEFAAGCRYSDCRHLGEAGCAVATAVQSGALDGVVYDSYVKLIKEQRRFEITAEEKRRLGKQFGKITREAKNYRKRYKF